MTKYLHFAFNVCIQFVLLMLSYYVALRFYRGYFDAALNAVPMYLSFLSLFLAVYFALMWKDLYSHDVHSYLKVTLTIIGKNLAIAALALLCAIVVEIVLIDDFNLVPIKALIFFGFAAFTIFGMHIVYYWWLKSLSRHGYFYKKVMLIGRSSSRFLVERFFQDMGETKQFCGTLRVATGEAAAKDTTPLWGWDQLPVWETAYIHRENTGQKYFQDFMEVVFRYQIGELVIFLGPNLSKEQLQHITDSCDKYAIGYYIVPDLSSLPYTKHWNKVFSYIPIITHATTNRDNLFNISIKRLFDIFVSLLALLLFLPFGLVISMLIFLTDFGPVFYVSERVGKDGQKIPFFKFRSMHKNADQRKKELLPLNEREGEGPLFKIKNDPRVTRIGHFLRRTSLDEFPQFVNVLLGHLSVVGPRPHLPEEVQYYVGQDFMRLECMPGITCLPQLRDRNCLGFHEWIGFDLYYRKNWTLRLDFYIFWHTALLFLKSFFVT